MRKLFGITLVCILTLVLAGVSVVQIRWLVQDSGFALTFFIYLILFLWWASIVIFFKVRSSITLYAGFAVFVVGALFVIFGKINFSEPLFRASFVFWIIGLAQSLLEYNKFNGK